ncbi:MAG: UDP-N-acetylmuramate dehydrogenase [Myxococcota bacterium]
MPLPTPTLAALKEAGLAPSIDAPLARRTWWQVGGPADGYLKVGTIEQVQAAVSICTQTECPLFVLGNGTNLLISDRGIRGLVLQLGKELARADTVDSRTPPLIDAGAGTRLAALVQKAMRSGWTGLEVFAGIPGTIGGAVRMNAGARLGETKDVLVEVDAVLPDGTLRTLTQEALQMSYRTTLLPPGAVVVRARLQCTREDAHQMRTQVKRHLDHRASTQPLDLPSCGSTFRNPPGDHAGRLIEAAGLKGFQIGDAQVSEKHANFIVNQGAATADDLRRVIEHVQATVQTQFGVSLQREVHMAGDWSHWESGPSA